MARHEIWHHATLSDNELDLILGFDPDINPNELVQDQVAELVRWACAVQSIIDDSIESWA